MLVAHPACRELDGRVRKSIFLAQNLLNKACVCSGECINSSTKMVTFTLMACALLELWPCMLEGLLAHPLSNRSTLPLQKECREKKRSNMKMRLIRIPGNPAVQFFYFFPPDLTTVERADIWRSDTSNLHQQHPLLPGFSLLDIVWNFQSHQTADYSHDTWLWAYFTSAVPPLANGWNRQQLK